MKKILFPLLLLGVAATVADAQETYQNATLATPDLNGSARYVGMGGAMEALGADLSVIGSNPAGIGLFRHSHANVSFGWGIQSGTESSHYADKSVASFDQAGFVWSSQISDRSYLNFAFNYTKDRNFNSILSAVGNLGGASQANMTYNKLNNDLLDGWRYSQLDYVYMDQFYSSSDGEFYDFQGDQYAIDRGSWGYIGRYDFNISGNSNDRIFWGVTFGVYDVNYHSMAAYSETSLSSDVSDVVVESSTQIDGTGFDIKAGLIFRPIEESPFRIGLSVATPIFYDLSVSSSTMLSVYEGTTTTDYYTYNSEYYEFRMNTPWRFGLSLGHTIGSRVALGASYEYADYGSIDSRIKDGYDEWGYSGSTSDDAMNAHTGQTLCGVSTLKIGAEIKPDPMIAIRLGFNYVSPMYEDYGYKDTTIDSPGTYYQNATDYTNWDSTYRLTCGLGFKFSQFNLDLAYQYSTTKGEFHPFQDGAYYNNYGDAVDVSNHRHQILLSLGYTL